MKIQQPITFQAVTYQSLTVMDHTAFPIFKAEIFPSMKSTLFSFLQSNAVENLKAPAQLYPKCTNQQFTVKILHRTVISPQNPITSPSWWMICCCHGRVGISHWSVRSPSTVEQFTVHTPLRWHARLVSHDKNQKVRRSGSSSGLAWHSPGLPHVKLVEGCVQHLLHVARQLRGEERKHNVKTGWRSLKRNQTSDACWPENEVCQYFHPNNSFQLFYPYLHKGSCCFLIALNLSYSGWSHVGILSWCFEPSQPDRSYVSSLFTNEEQKEALPMKSRKRLYPWRAERGFTHEEQKEALTMKSRKRLYPWRAERGFTHEEQKEALTMKSRKRLYQWRAERGFTHEEQKEALPMKACAAFDYSATDAGCWATITVVSSWLLNTDS